MKSVCLCFKIHQPFRLKRYRFFDIGNDHYYYDDFADDEIISRVAAQSYIPMAETLLEMIEKSNKAFKFAIMISGTAIEQLQLYQPEVIDLFKKLADTGCMEILSGTYSHSLSSIMDTEEFVRDVKMHDNLIRRTFGKTPKVFANTELIYDDEIGLVIKSMGFNTAVTEGAKHIMGWKSPNYLYNAASSPGLKLMFINAKLSQDITRRFNDPEWHEYPLTADKYMGWIASLPEHEQVVNLCMSMDTFGTFLPQQSGIFEFLKALPVFAKEMGVEFSTPSEISKKLKPIGEMVVVHPISGAGEARDVSAWMGNDLQREALKKLYDLAERVNLCSDRRLKQDWEYLQSSDHFLYMKTKGNDGEAALSPYDSPYSAFTNYMNVLADFTVRVEGQYPEEIGNEELNSLLLTISNQAAEIADLEKKMKSLRTNILNADDGTYKVEETGKETKSEAPEAAKPKESKPKAEKKAEIKAAKKAEPKAAAKPTKKAAAKPTKKAVAKTSSKAKKSK